MGRACITGFNATGNTASVDYHANKDSQRVFRSANDRPLVSAFGADGALAAVGGRPRFPTQIQRRQGFATI